MMETVMREEAVKTEPVGALGDKGVFNFFVVTQLIGIEMPFANIFLFISGIGKHMSNTAMIRIQTDLINYHAG